MSARSPFDDRPAIGVALVRFGLALIVLVAGVFQVQRHDAAVADARVWGLPSPDFSGVALPPSVLPASHMMSTASRPG